MIMPICAENDVILESVHFWCNLVTLDLLKLRTCVDWMVSRAIRTYVHVLTGWCLGLYVRMYMLTGWCLGLYVCTC